MSDLERHLEFVNRQSEFHDKLSKQFATQGIEKKTARHSLIAAQYRELSEFLSANANRLNDVSGGAIKRLSLSWDEVQDLPQEMISQLGISDGDKLEFDIVQIVEDCGGVASLDRVLLEVYKRTGEVTKRTGLNNRLYRMVQKELIHSVPGKKGVYSTRPLSEDEARTLI